MSDEQQDLVARLRGALAIMEGSRIYDPEFVAQGLRDAIAVLSQGEGVQDWQPIATAPKDGTWILLHGPSYGVVEPIVIGCWSYSSNVWQDYDSPLLPPTHWMPLPTPPAAPAEETAQRPAPTEAQEAALRELVRDAQELGIYDSIEPAGDGDSMASATREDAAEAYGPPCQTPVESPSAVPAQPAAGEPEKSPLADALKDCGMGDGSSLQTIQRRLNVDFINAERLLGLREAIRSSPTAGADLDARVDAVVAELLADDGFAYSADVPPRFKAIIRRALEAAREGK